MKNNFFKPDKDGTVLHLTKSGRWERCTIPVGCTRHVDPTTVKNITPVQEPPEWSREAWENRSDVLSVEDYNGYEPPEYDPMDEMKMGSPEDERPAYVKKQVNYHYSCPSCRVPFEPVKTVAEMDAQVQVHDCDNLTRGEAHKRRKVLKEDMGVIAFMDKVGFKPSHEQCHSYQTACADCAEQHELKLYDVFTREELGDIVREDSMFYNPQRQQVVNTVDANGEEAGYLSNNFRSVINDVPPFEAWQYLPNKSTRQLRLESEGVNYGNHIAEDESCRVCGQTISDMYCMDCWSPAGYLNS